MIQTQKTAAWKEVAQGIAHEIKNPLTPIQLSAERLQRKYAGEITSDKGTFDTCTDTIIRQVEDIGRLIDEFSSFAQMPQPHLKPINLSELCRQIGFLEQNRFPEIQYELNLPKNDVTLRCDRQQIGQVLTNLLMNAAESISSRPSTNLENIAIGCIYLELEIDTTSVVLNIVDNGIGLPSGLLDRITEPYVTGRDKGTGLGLAITNKIMEDHNGELILRNNDDMGATATLVFKTTDGSS